jgi:amino acid permease
MKQIAKYEKYQVKLTEWEGFVSTFNALVGIGILSCPSAYKDVGLLGGVIGNLAIIIIFNLLYT